MQAGAGRFQKASGRSSMRKTRFLKLGGGESVSLSVNGNSYTHPVPLRWDSENQSLQALCKRGLTPLHITVTNVQCLLL